MQNRLPAFRGPSKPAPKPAPKPVEPSGGASCLAALIPLPPELAADAVTVAGKLLEAVGTHGVRLRRADRACCEEVLYLAAAQAPMSWHSAGRVLKIARLHLAPPV